MEGIVHNEAGSKLMKGIFQIRSSLSKKSLSTVSITVNILAAKWYSLMTFTWLVFNDTLIFAIIYLNRSHFKMSP